MAGKACIALFSSITVVKILETLIIGAMLSSLPEHRSKKTASETTQCDPQTLGNAVITRRNTSSLITRRFSASQRPPFSRKKRPVIRDDGLRGENRGNRA